MARFPEYYYFIFSSSCCLLSDVERISDEDAGRIIFRSLRFSTPIINTRSLSERNKTPHIALDKWNIKGRRLTFSDQRKNFNKEITLREKPQLRYLLALSTRRINLAGRPSDLPFTERSDSALSHGPRFIIHRLISATKCIVGSVRNFARKRSRWV